MLVPIYVCLRGCVCNMPVCMAVCVSFLDVLRPSVYACVVVLVGVCGKGLSGEELPCPSLGEQLSMTVEAVLILAREGSLEDSHLPKGLVLRELTPLSQFSTSLKLQP